MINNRRSFLSERIRLLKVKNFFKKQLKETVGLRKNRFYRSHFVFEMEEYAESYIKRAGLF